MAAEELAGTGAALQKFQEFGKGKAALFEDVRESALRNPGVHRNDRPPIFVAHSFFKRDMTALLAELHETGPFQSLDHALARDARQLGHVSGKLRR